MDKEAISRWSSSLIEDVMKTSEAPVDLGVWTKTVVMREIAPGEFEAVPEECTDWERVA